MAERTRNKDHGIQNNLKEIQRMQGYDKENHKGRTKWELQDERQRDKNMGITSNTNNPKGIIQ